MKRVVLFAIVFGALGVAAASASSAEAEPEVVAGPSMSVEAAPDVTSHPGPNVRRTVKRCKALKKPGKRAACLACIARKKPHHFHPRLPKGQRCRPNNGKP